MTGAPEISMAGTLTADPELRFTNSGTAVANFTVAANERRFDKETGQWVDAGATFLRCAIWRDTAEHVANSLAKGMRVLLNGSLRQRNWETPEGERRSAFEVDVTEIGPSLKWATARVTKATRNNGASDGDTWETTVPAGSGTTQATTAPGEPPF